MPATPEGIESKLTLPACACHTIPLIANICSPHACSTLLQHSVSPSYFNREQRSRTNKGFVIYGRVKEGRIVPAHVVELRYDPPLILTLDNRSKWLVSPMPRPFTTGKRTTGTHWPEGWVTTRDGLNSLHQTGAEARLFSHIQGCW